MVKEHECALWAALEYGFRSAEAGHNLELTKERFKHLLEDQTLLASSTGPKTPQKPVLAPKKRRPKTLKLSGQMRRIPISREDDYEYERRDNLTKD